MLVAFLANLYAVANPNRFDDERLIMATTTRRREVKFMFMHPTMGRLRLSSIAPPPPDHAAARVLHDRGEKNRDDQGYTDR